MRKTLAPAAAREYTADRMRALRHRSLGIGLLSIVAFASVEARAQDPLGTPPPDSDKVAKGPDAPKDALKLEKAPEGITASVSAGGLTSSGNSKLLAFTGSGLFDARDGDNGYGASLIGNYGRSAASDGPMETTTENLQGRLRYDRFLLDDASVFLLTTGRHDRFQGLAFRLNVDPGVKYLFINRPNTALWGELGYDFQYDVRTDEAREVRDDAGNLTETLEKTDTDHSARAFLGLRLAFNKDVTLSNGLEYLQSIIDAKRYRFNYDILLAANIWNGLAFGAGFSARFDNQPLPDIRKLDTSTTLSLVYSYSTLVKE
jgi:putative salt-induced outer membrane protein